jgi:hypothetical protein
MVVGRTERPVVGQRQRPAAGCIGSRALSAPLDRNVGSPPRSAPAAPDALLEVEHLGPRAEPELQQEDRRNQRNVMAGGASDLDETVTQIRDFGGDRGKGTDLRPGVQRAAQLLRPRIEHRVSDYGIVPTRRPSLMSRWRR